ncbi:MAG: hypothetical protein QOC59_782 [Microbacteriaceae bacterium]|nr:hypothetical protein [Microbacteriaceae bacterium]
MAGILATAQTDLVVEHPKRAAISVPLVIDARLPVFPGAGPEDARSDG